MTLSRDDIESHLEAFVLDALDDDLTRAIDASLAQQPDLADRATRLQAALASLAYEHRHSTPTSLRARILDAANARRPAGVGAAVTSAASAIDCYRITASNISTTLAGLSTDDRSRQTVYRISVGELVRHLNGVERHLIQQLEGGDSDIPTPSTHRAMRDDVDAADPRDAVATWFGLAGALESAVEAGGTDDTILNLGNLSLGLDVMLVARAFELWTHDEDIRRATGRPLAPPPAAVLHSMAATVLELLPSVMAAEEANRGKSIRITLTGDGGGSWVRQIAEVGQPTTAPDPFATADGTLVADIVDFCRLAADRIDSIDGFDYMGFNDERLVGAAVSVLPTFADYGDDPLHT